MNAVTGEIALPRRVKDIRGQKFNRWTVKEYAGTDGKYALWKCICECGAEKTHRAINLRKSATKSCGCLRFENKGRAPTHGMTNTMEFRIWGGIKARIFNPKVHNYADYGGRGIKLHQPWADSFEQFFSDVGPCPGSEYSLDRFPDQNGNYEPSNVRWATHKQQSRNKRNNRLVTYRGETMPLSAWSERLGFRKMTLRNRLMADWSIEDAMTEPEKEKVLRRPRRKRRTDGSLV